MVNTLWSDISEFQVPVSDSYPYHFLCIRSNDGGYEDHHFTQNIAWCRASIHSGRLWGFMVYYFYRPGVNGAGVLMSRVGRPDPRLTVMIDVEAAGGQVSGNQSGAINGQFDALAHWTGDRRRVVGYGNTSDLNALWPQKPSGMRIVVAAYGSNPGYPGKFAHQFSDNANTHPFGPSDLNSADGMSQQDLEHMFGFGSAPPPPPPHSGAPPFPYGAGGYIGTARPDPNCHSGCYGGTDATHTETWQRQMKLTVDGCYGPNSEAACKSLQSRKHLTVDGLVGPQTWAATWS